MDDSLTQLVLGYQEGRFSLEAVRNPIVVEAYSHLSRYRKKGEDEVSEFLLLFFDKVEGMLARFRCRGLPFRHYLLRTLRWQWSTFRAERARERRKALLVVDTGIGAADEVAEPSGEWEAGVLLSPSAQRRLMLLILKAAPCLEPGHLEVLSDRTGADLAWLEACQYRLCRSTAGKRGRRASLVERRGEMFYRRLVAEDDARREPDPERRSVHERRAVHYRTRLGKLSQQQASLLAGPTHGEVAVLLGLPKGSVDSGLHHLKKELTAVYNGGHDPSPGHQQRP